MLVGKNKELVAAARSTPPIIPLRLPVTTVTTSEANVSSVTSPSTPSVAQDERSSSNTMASFVGTKKHNDSVMQSEILWTIHTVVCNNSFSSNNDVGDVFRRIFFDSKIAKGFSLAETKNDLLLGGFRGGSSLAGNHCEEDYLGTVAEFDNGHIAMTYTALASLLILGDDLSRVNRKAVLAHVAKLQCTDGSFYSSIGGSENDMRFVYCAAAICYILQDFSNINVEGAVKYITDSLSYEGAMGQGVNLESHGGSTYCAVAALHLMGELDRALSSKQRARLVRWLVLRQDHCNGSGLQGRPNKPPDTCYTFWLGASLKLLNCLDHLELSALRGFVLSTQDPITGGLAKYPDTHPDGLHTYLGVSGLSLLNCDDLVPVDPALNISNRALAHLKTLHRKQS